MGSTAYTNDANGNRTGRGTDTFTYDLANRLTKITQSSGTTDYAYDGDGKRVCKAAQGSCTSPEFTYDVNRGLPVLLQDTQRRYVWGMGLAYTADGTSGAGSVEVHHSDGLGSVRAVTGPSASVQYTYLTDDFGVSKLIRGGGSGLRMQYTGEPRDSESGFLYLRARMYDPGVGRFLQRDRIAGVNVRPQSLNRFTYVSGNPATLIDPRGLYEYQWSWLIGPKDKIGTAESVMTYFQQNPKLIFPFDTGKCATIQLGAECDLKITKFGQVANAPVEVTALTETSFTFTATEGHFDHPGSWVKFSILEKDGQISLQHKAKALTHNPLLDPVAKLFAYMDWAQMAENLKKALNPNPKGVPMPMG